MRKSLGNSAALYGVIGFVVLAIAAVVSAAFSGDDAIVWLFIPVAISLLPALILSVLAADAIKRASFRGRLGMLDVAPTALSYAATAVVVTILIAARVASYDGRSPWDPTNGLTFLSVVIGLLFGLAEVASAGARRTVTSG